ncbi:helicase-related protein [Segnochrobactraceae bacterium EtOH-i3]
MTVALRNPLPPSVRARTVTAVLGPTNTGKTHLAIERMLAHPSGLIGLPLRLLAREVYGRLVERAGVEAVALVTGEERIVPKNPRFQVCTVEAMPDTTTASFVAIDEVQLAGDFERGRVFTDRILSLRGRDETLFLGALTARPLLEKLLPGIHVQVRPRLSILAWTGSKKITRLPARSAIVAFSADEVYAIAELIRRQRGGAAVVLGSLSPRTRNAQVALFQSGDVDFLVATDAIGMGLNLDVEHVAFAGRRKFDGYQYRNLTAGELGQIAGRAGRYTRDGTFGVTGRVAPFEDELVEDLEAHRFAPLKMFQWRNSALDFSSLEALRRSLEDPPREEGLTRAPPAEDQVSLEYAARDPDIRALAIGRERVQRLWDVVQVPDYRRIAPANHADLVLALYGFLARDGRIREDWFARQVSFTDRTDGDIDTLSNRIAHIRTWTYIANRADWLADPDHWRGITRGIEDRLSDALHDRLTQRFVDRRTSVLMRRLRENKMLDAEITPSGDVVVEGQPVGRLMGFRFVAESTSEGAEGKAIRAAAAQALGRAIEARADRLADAPDEAFVLAADGSLRWLGDPVARLLPGETELKPGLALLADEQLTGPARDKVEARLQLWLKAHLTAQLKPLFDLEAADDLDGIARGIGFRLVERLGVLDRHQIAEDVRGLDQTQRATLRKYGVRFGAHHIYIPALLKPAPSRLLAELWALKHAGLETPGLLELPQLSASGRTSFPVDKTYPRDLYRVVGFRVCGERAVRIDILERLADIIRPIIAWKPAPDAGTPPEGAVPTGGAFTVTVRMTSLVGCAGEDFSSILKGLGYRMERRPAFAAPVVTPAAETEAAPAAEADAAPVEEAADAAPAAEAVEPAVEIVAEAVIVEPVAEAPAEAVTEEPATEVVVAEIGAEAVAVEGEAVETAEAAVPAEPETVEVWRPGRFERRPHERGEGNRRGGGERRGGNRGEGRGEGRGENRGGGERGERRDERPRGERPEGGRGPRPERSGEGKRRFDGVPGSSTRGGGPRPDRKDERPRRDDNRPGGADRGNRREERKVADPDSPFAKLAKLKEELESRNKR